MKMAKPVETCCNVLDPENENLCCKKIKKLSLYRPGGALGVPGS
jgi:hypothetical protein